MPTEPYRTSIEISAPPDAVYPFLTEPESILRWMGDYAVLDARPGGEFTLDINGVPVRGHYIELDPPHRMVIAWGHAGSDLHPPGVQHRRDHSRANRRWNQAATRTP
ncbi:MAG: SRPBCC family protein [bacterium]